MTQIRITTPLQYGKQVTLRPLSQLSAGTQNYTLTMDSSAAIISLYVPILTGTVDCRVYTRTDEGHEVLKDSFTQLTSAQSSLIQLRVNDVMGELRVELIVTGSAEVELKAKAAHSITPGSADNTIIDDSALVVQNPLIQNVTLASANTEETINLPISAKRFLVRARGNSTLKLSFTSGQSGTLFLTMYPGYEYIEENIDRITTQLFVQSSKAGEIVEIVSWQ